MLSHVKLPYPGRPQVRGSEINRGAVGFQLILLCVFIQARTPWRCSCYTSLQLSTSLIMSDYVNTATPEELTISMIEELMSEVKNEVLDEVLEEVFEEYPTPMSCDDFLQVLRHHFNFTFPEAYEDVFFDEYNRCHIKYFADHKMWNLLPRGRQWTFEESHCLVKEVLHLMQREVKLGVKKMYPIRSGEGALGMSLGYIEDAIFVQCGGGRHPFDVVSTTLHELAHHMVFQTPHCLTCDDGHCQVWRRCVKVLTAIFAKAKKNTFYLSQLNRLYGSHWSLCIVQGVKSCNGCQGLPLKDETEKKCTIIYTSAQLDSMWREKNIQINNKLGLQMEDDDEWIDISDDEDGWQTCLPEVELLEPEPEYWL